MAREQADTPEHVRAALDSLAQQTVGWKGALPDGELAEHFDSMQRLVLVVAIEDHFQIAIEDEDEEAVRTVDDVVKLVMRKRAEGGA